MCLLRLNYTKDTFQNSNMFDFVVITPGAYSFHDAKLSVCIFYGMNYVHRHCIFVVYTPFKSVFTMFSSKEMQSAFVMFL